MPVTNSGAPVDNIREANAVYREDAAKLFVAAHDGLPRNPAVPAHDGVPAIPQESAEDAKKRSQIQLSAAFSQLSNAATVDSAQDGRDGYAAVVALMEATKDTAKTIYDKIDTFVKPQAQGGLGLLNPGDADIQTQLDIIKALTGLLQALAQISPSPVWQKDSTSGG